MGITSPGRYQWRYAASPEDLAAARTLRTRAFRGEEADLDARRRLMQAAARILELTQELPLNIKKKAFVVNQAKENQEADIQKSAKEFGLELSGIIPDDPLIREFDLSGKPTTHLTTESKAVVAAFKIFERIL